MLRVVEDPLVNKADNLALELPEVQKSRSEVTWMQEGNCMAASLDFSNTGISFNLILVLVSSCAQVWLLAGPLSQECPRIENKAF